MRDVEKRIERLEDRLVDYCAPFKIQMDSELDGCVPIFDECIDDADPETFELVAEVASQFYEQD